MRFNSFKEMRLKLETFKMCGMGSQGICYLDANNKRVYKVFHEFYDEYEDTFGNYEAEELLKFKDIKNKTYIFSDEVIYVGDKVVGYVTDYTNSKSLYLINPLNVSLDTFIGKIDQVLIDNKILASNSVLTYDVEYNILYGSSGFKIIDQIDYCYSNLDENIILKKDTMNFSRGIMYFLIDGYFDTFVSKVPILKEMYLSDVDIKKFLKVFRRVLSEYLDQDIKKLSDANKCLNKSKYNKKYERGYR